MKRILELMNKVGGMPLNENYSSAYQELMDSAYNFIKEKGTAPMDEIINHLKSNFNDVGENYLRDSISFLWADNVINGKKITDENNTVKMIYTVDDFEDEIPRVPIPGA